MECVQIGQISLASLLTVVFYIAYPNERQDGAKWQRNAEKILRRNTRDENELFYRTRFTVGLLKT
jgi:hypothetical protein